MLLEDVIYISLLLGCIAFGPIYRHMSNERVNRKRWVGSAVGFGLMVAVSGIHAAHVISTFAVATMIILVFDVRQSHVFTFVVLFIYLLFFRMTEFVNIPAPPGHTNLIQMMVTLKLVGLAFERNTAAKEIVQERAKTFANDDDRNISAIKLAYYEDILDLNVEDIFHYCFNYVGMLTGPYFSYRTFRDYFTARFYQFVNCEQLMLQRLKWIAVYSAFVLSCSYLWPINYALSDEFYFERSIFYRIWYVFPSFFVFRMRIYIGLTLSECICIMAGFGAYPRAFKSRPGGGPRAVVALDRPIAESQFDFETVHNFDAETTEECTTVREAMRSYHMTVQYWMAEVVYHRFPVKRIRTIVTLLVSAFWHGIYSGYFMSMLGAPLYLPVEAIWDSVFRQKSTGMRRKIWDVFFWMSKTFTLSYLGMAFLLMTIDKIMYFYRSVYHIGYFWGGGLFIVGMLAQQQAKMSGRNKAERAATPAPTPTPTPAPSATPAPEESPIGATTVIESTPMTSETPAPEAQPAPPQPEAPAPEPAPAAPSPPEAEKPKQE